MSAVPAPTNGATPAPIDPVAVAGRDVDPITIGQIMARSGLFPDINRASQAVVKILAGRELGIGPFAAMSDIHLIDGKPVVGARILAALVRQSPAYDYRVVEWTNERCAIEFYRHGEKLEPTVTFSEEDAERAGLNKPTRNGRPSNHMKFPRNMKFARAISNGVGLHCPDLTAGTPVYTPDELGGEEHDADVSEVVEASPTTSDPQDAPPEEPATGGALSEAAESGGYTRPTLVELCRFFYDQADPERLSAEQAAEMTDRLRLAVHRGLADTRLRTLATRGLAMDDRRRARIAADTWLCRKLSPEQGTDGEHS